eukprot:CAMPEP_0116940760 /NCGR_PEP_ID=MMETSP0467-20121206/33567_1 /TAXON_ID=283647 /ORGANISM="Mesodinium pulex, Strain SPMC105" /LENGTH=161 /DNA_ID=CAMNT_0004623379 /DNA_START=314 /DNA_END=801 /DNA_ORIENTATION=-
MAISPKAVQRQGPTHTPRWDRAARHLRQWVVEFDPPGILPEAGGEPGQEGQHRAEGARVPQGYGVGIRGQKGLQGENEHAAGCDLGGPPAQVTDFKLILNAAFNMEKWKELYDSLKDGHISVLLNKKEATYIPVTSVVCKMLEGLGQIVEVSKKQEDGKTK